MIRTIPQVPGGIIWLASYPKSGNTWLRMLLYHTTRIMNGVPLEGNDLHQIDRSSLYEARAVSLFEEFLGQPVAVSSVQEIIEVRPKVQAEIARRSNRPISIKTHAALVNLMDTPVINTAVTCGAIYIVRNPLDIVLSLSDHLGYTIDETITVLCQPNYYSGGDAETVYEHWGSWSENVESWTNRQSELIYTLRYEDLLANPIKGFRSATDHLQINPTPTQLAQAVELSDFSRLGAIEKENDFRERSPYAERFFRVGRANQWPDKLTPEQIGRVVAANHVQMSRCGYITDELRRYIPTEVDPETPDQAATQ